MNESIQFSEKFSPMDRLELHETHGGAWPLLLGIGIAAGAGIINDWDNFKNGLLGRPEVK